MVVDGKAVVVVVGGAVVDVVVLVAHDASSLKTLTSIVLLIVQSFSEPHANTLKYHVPSGIAE